MLSPAQCRAARALLDWTQSQLSDATGLSAVTIRAFEAGRPARESNQRLLLLALEAAGVEFIPENGGGAGVRLRQRGRGRAEAKLHELAASMLEAENPGLKFEASTRPSVPGQGTKMLATPAMRDEYIAKARARIAEDEA